MTKRVSEDMLARMYELREQGKSYYGIANLSGIKGEI